MANYVTIANKLIAFANAKDDWDETEIPFSNAKNFINAAGNAAGVTNDSTNGDDAAITAAIAAVASLTQAGTVYFPPGIYYIKTGITVANCNVVCSPDAKFIPLALDISMVSMGKSSSWDGGFFDTNVENFAGVVFDIDGADFDCGMSSYAQRSPRISNVDMLSYAAETSAGFGTAIKIYGDGHLVTFGRVQNCRIRNYEYGLHITASTTGYVNGWTFDNIDFVVCGHCIYMAGTGTYGIYGNKFTNISFQPGTGTYIITQEVMYIGALCVNNLFTNMMFVDLGDCVGTPVQLRPTAAGNKIMGGSIQRLQIADYGTMNQYMADDREMSTPTEIGVTWEPGTLADHDTATKAVAAPYTQLGDAVIAAAPYSLAGCLCCAYPTGTNTAEILVCNETAGEVPLASGDWKIKTLPKERCNFATTVEPGAIAAGGFYSTGDITYYGVALGDLVLAGPGVDLNGVYCTCAVTAADTITVTLNNLTSGEITLASSTWCFYVFPKTTSKAYLSRDIPSLNDGIGANYNQTATGRVLLGDFVCGTVDKDNKDVALGAYCYQNIGVTLRAQNESGGVADIDAGFIRFWIWKQGDPWRI